MSPVTSRRSWPARAPFAWIALGISVVLVFADAPTALRAADPSAMPTASTDPVPSTPPDADAPGAAPQAPVIASTIVGYRASGYRYEVVARGAGAGFEAASYDDSAWGTGTAAFGSGGACALQSSVATSWPTNTDVLVRRHVSLPAGTTGVTVAVAIDNDVQVYWNGVLVGSNVHENCPTLDSFVYPVADSLLLAGDNVLAVRGIDRGNESMLDISVRGSTPAVISPDRFLGPGASPHQNDPTGKQREPVNTYSGNYTSTGTDLALPGRGVPFAFSRTYNSIRSGIDGPLGPGWSHPYGASLTVNGDGSVTFVSEDGSALPFRPDGAGGFTGDPGILSTLAPVVGGGYTLTRRDGLRYAFDATGMLLSETDRNGNGLGFIYSGADMTTVTDSVGRTVTLTVDAAGHITALGDPIGRTIAYGYDIAGRLASVTDVRGGVTAYTYDAGGRLATITDQNANVVVTNTYDAGGRVVEQLDARGLTSTFAYDSVAQTTTMTDARGGQWVDSYSGPALIARRDPLGNTGRSTYDAAFNRTSATDPNNNTTTMTYDARGNLLSRTAPAPLGYVEAFTYNAANDLLTAQNRRGNTMTNTYDAAGNLTKATAPDGTFSTFTYGPQGLVQTSTDPRGKTTTYGYDTQANLTSTTTPLGNITTMSYDAAGRMLTVVDPRGNAAGSVPADYTTSLTYNAADQVLSATDPLGNVTTTTYDPAGRRTSVTDAKNRTTTHAYDPANHLTAVTDALGGLTAYAYDPTGNLVSRTDANNHVTGHTYDLAGRLTSTTDPAGRAWTLAYDPAGNVATRTDANNKTTTFGYDALNRLTAITFAANSTPPVSYAYDGNGNRTTMTDGAGSETYAYDALDRLTRVTRGADVFSYAFDAASNPTARTYPDGTLTTHIYDDDGRLVSAAGGGSVTAYTYDPAANLLTAATPDGFTARNTFDRAGRLLEVAHTSAAGTLSRATYGLDPVGNRTRLTTTRETQLYFYDALDRLTKVCYGSCPGGGGGGGSESSLTVAPASACLACGGTSTVDVPPVNDPPPPGDTFTAWTYDPVGSRLTETNYQGTKTYAYDAADRLTGTTGPGTSAPTTYTYDANGNQTGAGDTTYAYDLADRLVSASVGNTTEAYGWSGDGIRISAATGPQAAKTVRFAVDRTLGQPSVAIERDGAGKTLRRYTYGLDLLSQATPTKGPYFYHHDGLGSVTDITSSSGTALAWTEYTPFGAPRASASTSQAPAVNPFRFTGEYRDSVTGLYHLRARQYDPGTGRFTALDPRSPAVGDPYVSAYV